MATQNPNADPPGPPAEPPGPPNPPPAPPSRDRGKAQVGRPGKPAEILARLQARGVEGMNHARIAAVLDSLDCVPGEDAQAAMARRGPRRM